VADGLVRGLGPGGAVRAFAAVTTDLVEEARRRHGTLPTATAALGRALTVGLLLGSMQKDGERVSLEWSGDGPLRTMLVDATAEGSVRGFVARPLTHLPARAGKLDVGGAIGRGVLCVMRIPRGEGTPYRSVVPLVSGEIGADVARYLATSEQTPSAVGVGVFVEADGRVGAAGGWVVQAMPEAEPGVVDALEANVAAVGAPSDLVRHGLDAASILGRLLDGAHERSLEARPVRFQCRCTRERVGAAILAMGRAEIEDVLAGERRAEVTCEFCATRYVLEADELIRLLATASERDG
jgi:molecular chaperone Hsp33